MLRITYDKNGINNKVFRFVENALKKHIYFQMGLNCSYTKEDVLRMILLATSQNTYIEPMKRTLHIDTIFPVPDADTIHYHLKKNGIDEIKAQMKECNSDIFKRAKKQRLFNTAQVVAVDYNDHPFHGKSLGVYRVGSKKNKGTNYATRIATIDILKPNERYTLHSIPVKQFDSKVQHLRTLITEAEKHVKIKLILLDRGFCTIDCINFLRENGYKYLMPVSKDDKIKKEVKKTHGLFYRFTDYRMGTRKRGVNFTLIIVDSCLIESKEAKEAYYTYATNMKVNRKNVIPLVRIYDRRWGIETGYEGKNNFVTKTRSTDVKVRIFLRLLTVLLFNLWTILRAQADKFNLPQGRDGFCKASFRMILLFMSAAHLLENRDRPPP